MQLYNTLSRRLEAFALAGPAMTMYVCGVTPYDTTHLGHARCYVVYDVLQRYVRYGGHDVRYVQNVTDVDDDLLRKAQELGQPYQQVAADNLAILRRDMEALNVLPPAVWPRATQEVSTMLEIAQALVARGQAYARDGNVYFRAAAAPDFGALSRYTSEQMIARLREERFDPDDPRKEQPLDILMWQAAAPGEPTWESPWGPGRPGWHIECTAMALRHLGTTIDVHGGGEDLVFSHHDSERAQAETYTGVRPFVRFWVYAGTVYAGHEKMSKSLRNLVLVRELLPRYRGDAIRLYFAQEHYRAHLTFEEARLAEAAALAERLRAAAALAAPGEGPAGGDARAAKVPASDDFRARFEAAMDADLDTPGAVEVLRDLAAAIETYNTGPAALGRAALLNELASVLGLRLTGQPATIWPE
jgi:L-cysteine:1D-myo-inositol 2-amino-2-deoxy-alpha-D-glucopyranoside ligase